MTPSQIKALVKAEVASEVALKEKSILTKLGLLINPPKTKNGSKKLKETIKILTRTN